MTRDLFPQIKSLTPAFSRTASQRPSPSPVRRPNRRFTPGAGLDGLEGRLAPSFLFPGSMQSNGAFLTTTVTNQDGSTGTGGPTTIGTNPGTAPGTGTGTLMTGPDTPPVIPIV